MARSSLPAGSLLALAAGLLLASSATAAPDARISEPQERGTPEGWIEAIPVRCAPFAPHPFSLPLERPTSVPGWQQLLSFAACAQDASAAATDDPGELAPMVEEMSRRLALPMLIYLDALEHGDAPVQLRATFQIGMAYVALGTRARSALSAPPDLNDPAAATRYCQLHARLESLLAPARHAALIAFQAIDEAAGQEATLVADDVERNIVAMARQMLPSLRDADPEAPPAPSYCSGGDAEGPGSNRPRLAANFDERS
jgi:hypothetical protein